MKITPIYGLKKYDDNDYADPKSLNENVDILERELSQALVTAPGGTAGKFDRLTASPTGTQPLRYNGYFRATRVYGMYYSDAADYGEAYDIRGEILPGELVMVAPGGELARNTIRGNPKVLGIVSTAPAAVIGATPGCQVPIALAGRVPAKVRGEVSAGDYLMGAETPGLLVRADADAPRGGIVGMALEDKPGNQPGQVLTFLLRL